LTCQFALRTSRAAVRLQLGTKVGRVARVVLTVVCLYFAAAVSGQGDRWKVVEFALPSNADASGDVEQAVAQGDLRFVGVWGFAVDLPGLNDADKALVTSQGIKVISGTSDAASDAAQARLNTRAEEYATIYNSFLKDYLRRKKGSVNNSLQHRAKRLDRCGGAVDSD
jgi:hypothetical protein